MTQERRPSGDHFSRDRLLVTALSVCRVTLPDAKQVQLARWHAESGGLAGRKGVYEEGDSLIQQSAKGSRD